MAKGQARGEEPDDQDTTEPETDSAGRARAAREHAFDFLLPADPDAAIRRIAERLIAASETDEEVADKFRAMRDRINGTVLLGPRQFAMYERLAAAGGPRLDVPTAPTWLRSALVAAYLRARSIIASGRVQGITADPARALGRALALADTLEPEFVGELVVETTLAAQRDPEFARRLESGSVAFRRLVDSVYGRLDPDDLATGSDERSRRVMARMAGSGAGGGGGDCTCCTTINGSRTCEPCSCWIIVVIIIVIIVAK